MGRDPGADAPPRPMLVNLVVSTSALLAFTCTTRRGWPPRTSTTTGGRGDVKSESRSARDGIATQPNSWTPVVARHATKIVVAGGPSFLSRPERANGTMRDCLRRLQDSARAGSTNRGPRCGYRSVCWRRPTRRPCPFRIPIPTKPGIRAGGRPCQSPMPNISSKVTQTPSLWRQAAKPS